MKSDQEFWEQIVVSLAPVIMEAATMDPDVIGFLKARKKRTDHFVAELAAATADGLLNERNKRIHGRPLEENAEIS